MMTLVSPFLFASNCDLDQSETALSQRSDFWVKKVLLNTLSTICKIYY